MLLAESENAKLLRSKILDIVIETTNERTGGGTKYINRKDSDYLPTVIRESKYRKEFTLALVDMLKWGIINILCTQTKYTNVFFRKMLRNINKY